jgi:hypothetical protein
MLVTHYAHVSEKVWSNLTIKSWISAQSRSSESEVLVVHYFVLDSKASHGSWGVYQIAARGIPWYLEILTVDYAVLNVKAKYSSASSY